jgi:hypothetical protein
MNVYGAMVDRPRMVGIACATGAVMLGAVYLAAAGAPARYVAINAGAFVIAIGLLALLDRAFEADRYRAAASAAMAAALLATALLGVQVEGAARWVSVAGLSLQPSLILLPVMLASFARSRGAAATAGIVMAAIALALQPDRAMAGMLVAGLAALAILRRDRHVIAALGVSVTGFAATLARADTLPAVPYVDRILYSSFDVHAVAGAAVLGGSAMLLVPAIVGWRRDPANRPSYLVLGVVWSAAIAAAALGNYPTPVVGYGGSAILGYVLSLLALPKRVAAPFEAGARNSGGFVAAPEGRHLRVLLA